MHDLIQERVKDGILAIQQLAQIENIEFMEDVAEAMKSCYEKGNKVLVAGNGGSLCDAMHFAEELTGQFCKPRPALPAIALADPGHITCAANDFGFERIFARGVEAYGKKGDIFVGLTTSGNSENIILAFEEAKKRGLTTVAFLGKGGGKLSGFADYEICINGFKTSDRVQEAHMTAIHIIIDMVEQKLFYQEPSLQA